MAVYEPVRKYIFPRVWHAIECSPQYVWVFRNFYQVSIPSWVCMENYVGNKLYGEKMCDFIFQDFTFFDFSTLMTWCKKMRDLKKYESNYNEIKNESSNKYTLNLKLLKDSALSII